jgi:serine/threonine protein kinase
MAPEVLFENEINCQADMWSLGCVLYEMVYGLSPFYSENNDILKTTLAEFKEHGKLTFPNTGVSRKI